MITEWEEFLDPYIQAVGELKIKLRGIRKQYRKQNKHSPIEFVIFYIHPGLGVFSFQFLNVSFF